MDIDLNSPARQGLLLGGAFALVAVIGYFDWVTGPEISFGIFYLVPVAMVAWYAGRTSAIVICVASAVAWFLADVNWARHFSHPLIPYWNAAVLLGFYLVTALTLCDLRRSLQRERELSRIDFLTGIANKRTFHELMQMEKNRASRYHHPLTIAYLDIDNFKQVNDSLGHLVGDELLVMVGHTLQESLRETDHVARLGGDEFAVLLPETEQAAADTVLRKLHSSLQQLGFSFRCPVSFSIGAVTFIEEPASLEQMMREADRVLYTAKQNGKAQLAHAVVSW
jgi:diguanylate cyclase (GGDEF)-like protein